MDPLRLNHKEKTPNENLVSERAKHWLRYLKTRDNIPFSVSEDVCSAQIRGDSPIPFSGNPEALKYGRYELIRKQLSCQSQQLAEVELLREIQHVDHQIILFKTRRQIEGERRRYQEELSALRRRLSNDDQDSASPTSKRRTLRRVPSALSLATRAISRGKSCS